MITDELVRHLGKLAKLPLTDTEVQTYTPQLAEVLAFFEQLKEVNTDDIPETSQVTGQENVTRPDEITVDGMEEPMLRCAPHPVEEHCIKVPKVL